MKIFNKLENPTYVMSLSWPGSTCSLKHCETLGKSNYFEIHGLWPENSMNCSRVNWKIKDLSEANKRDIPIYWNWMYNSEMGFINHELSKHGSCWNPHEADLTLAPLCIASVISNADLDSDHGRLNAYLQVPMAWSKHHDLHQVLVQGGIWPGEDTVSATQVVRVFEDYFGVRGGIFPVCVSKHPKKHYFSEIRFCFDSNYRMVSCGEKTVENHIKSCTERMLYPSFPKLEDDMSLSDLKVQSK